MKALVVYYSFTGKTELVARAIAQTLNADMRKIEEVKKRKKPFVFLTGGYEAIRGKSSEIKEMDFNLDCDLLFLGTPVWAGRPTPAVNAFVSKADFRNKKVVLFVTMLGISGKATKILTDAIESKGGKIIDSFSIKTAGVETERIVERGNEIGSKYTVLW